MANLAAVLAVAGKQRDGGSPGPLTTVSVQRKTGIARSTLRALRKPRGDADANPDLGTISRMAEALGVPPAFLLMRPQDWAEMALAIGDSRDYLTAATKLLQEDRLAEKNPIEKVLRECKVHPDARPKGVGASPEVSRVNARDEWRRRSCLKLDALMLRHAKAFPARAVLTAIASAMVSRATPHNRTF
ncbi:helix-turn-helix domain-containing protein [Caballeronia udeis]|nr:helix-turn-helix transcriptional regulator [Caballeronia udeis]